MTENEATKAFPVGMFVRDLDGDVAAVIGHGEDWAGRPGVVLDYGRDSEWGVVIETAATFDGEKVEAPAGFEYTTQTIGQP